MPTTPLIVMHRVDPPKRVYRWYSVHVQSTILEPWAVVCAWGNLRSSFQQERAIPCESKETAESLALSIVARKQKKGYKIKNGPTSGGL